MWTSSFRYGQDAKKELEFISSKLGLNKSQAITEAIHLFYTTLKESNKKQKSSAEIFMESGFVGSAEDTELISTNYKEKFSNSLSKKNDFRKTRDSR